MRYRIGGPIFGGAYTWRGLFSEFYGMLFNNYSPKAKLISLNNPRDEVLRELIVNKILIVSIVINKIIIITKFYKKYYY